MGNAVASTVEPSHIVVRRAECLTITTMGTAVIEAVEGVETVRNRALSNALRILTTGYSRGRPSCSAGTSPQERLG
jgi:hypothetical protein